MSQLSLAPQTPRCGSRRRFARLLAGAVAACLAACLAHAQPPSYAEGTHYERLPVAVDIEVPGKVEVTEVFSYSCIHCYTLDPLIEEWRGRLADDVVFRRVPAVFNESWAQMARVFYAAESLGVLDAVHVPIFQAIHQRGQNLTDPAVAAALFRNMAGVDPDTFDKMFTSFSVQTRLQQAVGLARAYGVTGVPTLIVNGKFRIDSKMAGSYPEMLKIADFLIDAERKAGTEPVVEAGE